MEGKNGSPGRELPNQLTLKRKSDPVPAEEGEEKRATKKQKPDTPVEELGDAGQDGDKGGADQNVKADEEKGKPVMPAEDKGKRKILVGGEEDEEESGNSGVEDKEGISDDDDVEKFLSDDSLTLMEVDNILPERTRPRDSLMILSPVRTGKINYDDDDDRDYCVDEQEEDEEDEETDDEEETEKDEQDDEEDKKEKEEEEEDYDEEEEAK